MNEQENYGRHLGIGLIFTLLVLAGITFYWVGESGRLVQAAESFAHERVSKGRVIYTEQCLSCHGSQGEGGVGPALNDRVLLKNTLDEVFFSVIRSGIPNTQMPAWSVDYGGPLTDEDVRDVVAFMRAWEPTAPEIEPAVFEPSPEQGALLFATTCAVCHGDNGVGTEDAPAINDPARLASLDDDWYRGTIRNGRPAKGMPTWGTVLSPNQVEDIVALIGAWRQGGEVMAAFSVTDLIGSAIFSLEEKDAGSATMHVERALMVAEGAGAEILRSVEALLASGDDAGALASLQALSMQWPIGDASVGAVVYNTYCSPCHGATGEGGIGPSLNPNRFIQGNTTPDLLDFIFEGRSGTAMAGFQGRLTEGEVADVIAFLRLWQP